MHTHTHLVVCVYCSVSEMQSSREMQTTVFCVHRFECARHRCSVVVVDVVVSVVFVCVTTTIGHAAQNECRVVSFLLASESVLGKLEYVNISNRTDNCNERMCALHPPPFDVHLYASYHQQI